jgi:thiol-disulfide isomerase/thioredoxin
MARFRMACLVAWILPLIAGMACSQPRFPPSASGHALLGKSLPRVHHRETLDGQPLDSAQLGGRPVLVKFFADYCAPCQRTLPAAERIHREHPEVVFLGIDEDESAETARGIVQRFGLTFPVIHDTANVLSGEFRVSAMPMTFVADASGTIRWIGDEKQTPEDLRQAVDAAR